MNIEEFREYCLSLPQVTEGFPFGEETLVFSIMGKMFALTGLDKNTFKVNLKCEPDYAIELREEYEQITPGFHMNKKHWNTIDFSSNIPTHFLKKLIKHSYEEVIKKLPKKLQNTISL